MQKNLLLFLFLFMGYSSTSQLNDSLWNIWNDNTQHDTVRLKAIQKITKDFINTQPDSAFYFAKLQYDFARSVNNKPWIADALNTQGRTFFDKGEYKNSMDYYTKSLKIYEDLGEKKNILNAYKNIGLIHKKLSDYAKAIVYFTRNLKIYEELEDQEGIASSLVSIGIIYWEQEDFSNTLDYFTRGLKINEEIEDQNGIASSSTNLGTVYKKLGDLEEKNVEKQIKTGILLNIEKAKNKQQQLYIKSVDHFTRGKLIFEELGYNYGIAACYNNIGMVYYTQADYTNAIDYHKRSLKIREQINNKGEISQNLNNLGNDYFGLGNYSKALDYCNRALNMAQELGDNKQIREASDALWKIHSKMGRYEKAFSMYQLFIKSRDTIASEKNKNEIVHQQYKYKYEKQATADSVKNAEEQKVKDALLSVEKAENKQHQFQADKQRQVSYFLWSGLALTLLFGGFIFNRFRVTNKQKKLIEIQHHELNETHIEITDSINYAKKIQDAMMTSSIYIQEVLPESFIFFQPKDVVSGDFYWVHQSPTGHVYFTVADCTGHGVPGAFMSMIGNSLLNEIIIENKIDDTGEILNQMRDQIINSLKKNGKT